MKAISLTQPWAWAILNAGKRVENRSRKDGRMPDICRHRGPLLLHAAKGMPRAAYNGASDFMARLGVTPPPPIQRESRDGILPRGVIVGRCVAIGYIMPTRCDECAGSGLLQHDKVGKLPCGACSARGSIAAQVYGDGVDMPRALDLRWWMGGWALILADVEPVKWVPCRGMLGLWEVPADVLRRLPE